MTSPIERLDAQAVDSVLKGDAKRSFSPPTYFNQTNHSDVGSAVGSDMPLLLEGPDHKLGPMTRDSLLAALGNNPATDDNPLSGQRLALESRSSTVLGKLGTPMGNPVATYQELELMAKPAKKAAVPKVKSLTPLPSLKAEEARRAKQKANAPNTRCIYGRKAQRKLAHPLEEERQFFDVWPANNRSILASLTSTNATAHNHQLRDTMTSKMGGTMTSNQTFNNTMASMASNTTAGGGGGAAATESVFSRPQLLISMEDAIRTELQRLGNMHPKFADQNPVNAPSEEQLSPRKWKSSLKVSRQKHQRHHQEQPEGHHDLSDVSLPSPVKAGGGGVDLEGSMNQTNATTMSALTVKSPSAAQEKNNDLGLSNAKSRKMNGPQFTSLCSEEDRFRTERIKIFSAAAKDFSNQFKSYRRLLLWIMSEFDGFASYCHDNVWSPDARDEFKRQVQEEADARSAAEKQQLLEKITELTNHTVELEEKYEKLVDKTSNSQQVIYDKERLIRDKDRELAEAAEGRKLLLQRIHRLEKEVWQQKNLMEGPEQKIAELNKTIKEQEERLHRANIVFEDNNREKLLLKTRIERLEDALRERKKQNSQQVSKAELLAIKKREGDMMEQNAVLQARVNKVQSRLVETQEALAALKSDRVTTPRPAWGQVDDIFPRAASSAQRVAIAAQEYRLMLDQKDAASVELQELKELIGALPRGDENTENELLVPQMQAKWFAKRGLDSEIPSYLKGNGRVLNLKFSRDTVQGYCRLLWIDRDGTRLTTSMEQYFSRFCAKNTPEDAEADSFAYSLFYGLHWYAYDAFVGFTKSLITNEIDDLVFRDLMTQVGHLKENLITSESVRPDAAATGQVVMSKTEVITNLMENMPNKEEEDIKRLIINLSRDCPAKDVDITTLFGFNEEESRFSFFLEEYYTQFLDERALLLKEYMEAVQDAQVDDDGMLSPPDLSRRFWHIDPEIPALLMDDLMACLFDVSVEGLFPGVAEDTGIKHVGVNGERVYGCDDTVTNDMTTIVQRLKSRPLRRFTLRSNLAAVLEKRERALAARQKVEEKDEEEETPTDE